MIQPSECKISKTEVESESLNQIAADNSEDNLEIKVIFNKKKYDVNVSSNLKISDFKKQLQSLLGMTKCVSSTKIFNNYVVGVPDSMQKLMYKGLLQDTHTISSSGITKGSKIMLVGSTLNDVLAVSSVSKEV